MEYKAKVIYCFKAIFKMLKFVVFVCMYVFHTVSGVSYVLHLFCSSCIIIYLHSSCLHISLSITSNHFFFGLSIYISSTSSQRYFIFIFMQTFYIHTWGGEVNKSSISTNNNIYQIIFLRRQQIILFRYYFIQIFAPV